MVFEFERQLLDFLGESISTEDETVGFRYFDGRDLLGFVDGTANPDAQDLNKTVCISAEDDPAAAGGCYIVVQKYVHDMGSWAKLSTEEQQNVIGRAKFDNIELSDAPASQQKAHKTLATVVNKYGEECEILRDNMPFGNPGQRVFGTYFIGYCKDLWVIEKMLERMFIGDPPGKYDKILDYSKAVTGAIFYAPPARVLQLLDN
ncbi:hypothetical protein VHEMI08237 [[Torrubiella] hemipterigena]|uniref:Dyp-type peroxidase C-terminal domain-containing protein n=1 Tax=[Torrubiella] hemipterigena TaxID=1531966 RepID=A0A0A1TCS8_9HYPO|nr:hypothetical protein VHEMI08237 [[Torrubiella] hemipterigena]